MGVVGVQWEGGAGVQEGKVLINYSETKPENV